MLSQNKMNTSTLSFCAPRSAGMLTPLQPFLEHPLASEIIINRPQEIYVEIAGTMHKHALPILTENYLHTLFQLIAGENQQILNAMHPLLSGSLLDGSRVQLVIPPVSLYPSLAIRRKTLHTMTLAEYTSLGFYQYGSHATIKHRAVSTQHTEEITLQQLYEQKQWQAFIHAAIQAKKNMVISGGTSSGKTTFLNACLHAILTHERLLILEDTREIQAPHANQLALLATKGDQGLTRVTMQDLVQASLRLRPDRIIVGEIRGKEILDFLAAAATGHEGSITTLHATTPALALQRMTQMYKLNHVPAMTDENIHQEITAIIDVIIQLEKTANGRQIQSVYYRG